MMDERDVGIPADETLKGLIAMPPELCGSFVQRQVWLVRNHRHYSFRLPFQWGRRVPMPKSYPL